MRVIKSLLCVFLILCSVISCKKAADPKQDVQEEIDNLFAYRAYISDVSQGIISTQDDIRAVLRSPVPAWSANEELDKNLFSISPRVKGKVIALNNQTIAFIPEDKLEQNTEYKLTLNLGDLIEDIPSKLSAFTFKVKTIKQQFNITSGQLQSYDKNWQYIEGTLRSSDQMTLKTARELIKAYQGSQKLTVKFPQEPEKGRQFSFRIDSIERQIEDSEINVSWDGGPFDIDSKGSEKALIPGKNNFAVTEVRVFEGTNPYIHINFSDPLKKDQNFDGLVNINSVNKLTFSTDGNLLKVYPGQLVKGTTLLEVFQGIQSEDGYKLKTTFSEKIAFEQIKPQVRLLQNGVILPSSDQLKINFETVSLQAVDVLVYRIFENNVLQFLQTSNLNEQSNLRQVARPIAKKKINLSKLSENTTGWSAYSVDLSELIVVDRAAIYRVEFNFKPSYSTYRCEQVNFEEEATVNFDEAETDFSYWDNYNNYYYYDNFSYDYNWNERDNPCHTSYYRNKKVATNLLASNLGVVIKKGLNESYFLSVNDILTTAPVEGAKVRFYNYQQQELGNVVTDANGTSIFDADRAAYFAIAEKGNQKTYVKLSDGNARSVSKFDVAGVKLQKGLKGFIYGERGVWRPGDTLFLSFILNDKFNTLPVSHPVKLELKDPYGKIIHREVRTDGAQNFYSFKVKTDENAPTGNWTAHVNVGGARFSKQIKIETIKPNRLKIKADFDTPLLSSTQNVSGSIEVAWLHGAVAKNLKADMQARFNQQTTRFKSFPGYIFDDPSRRFTTEELVVFDDKVDAQGNASFSFKPQLQRKAPGMLKASFITKVYENGGDFSTDVFTKTYSPYQTYIGLNVPKGDRARGMLLTDTKHKFEVVTVDENGNAKAVNNLKVTIHKVRWRWWWDTSEDNLSSYNGSNYREKVYEHTISTASNGKASFDFELKYPEWGRYLVRIEDPQGGHATGKAIYIDWPGWAGKSRKNDPSAATMLVFSTDKQTYNVGEKALVTFPGGANGRALVTIENGSEVLESLWVSSEEGETKFEIPIKAFYTPNVYISITLLQPHASTLNDLPIRMYGIVPIKVEDPATKLEPQISMPDVLRPEERIKIKVDEKSGKAMTYSLAIVDEGLLDLTRFKTPDPWNNFYAREALGIKTWDIYDDVVGAYGGRIDQVFGIGGDGEAAGAKNKKANRFKPMVTYLGPFELKESNSNTHEIKIPKYIGSVRTMVIAGDSKTSAYGKVEKTSPVRKPLMVLASLPRKMTPGEKITLPVTVFAMEEKVKNVTVRIKNDPSINIVGDHSKQLRFSDPDEKMAYFELEVADFSGVGKITVEAQGNGEKASYEIEIDVVNPNPSTTTVQNIVLEPNGNQNISLETFGVSGSNTATIEFSTFPSIDFTGRLQYLIQYPHGCVEQTTSAAFPQLYLPAVFDLTSARKKKIQEHIKKAINRLANFQLPSGGFSYWQGQNYANDWGSSYAGHFLLEAEKKGYVLPIGFKSSWIRYQQQAARQWRKSNNNSDLAQAYRLYVLALAGDPEVSSMNRLRESPAVSNEAKHRLAAAYALIGQRQAAKAVFDNANIDFKTIKYDPYTYGSTDRNRALAMETLILLENKEEAQTLAKTIAKQLGRKRWMSTQSTAYSLLAIAKFADFVGGKGFRTEITLNGKKETVEVTKTLASKPLDIKEGSNNLILNNKGGNTVFVSIVNSGILAVGKEKTEVRNLEAQLRFKNRDGSNLDVKQISQGTDFIAEVTITNKKGEQIDNVALSEIFPSGWEIVNTRFTDFGSFAQNKVDYTDLRDDRANFYFDLKGYESKTVRILLNASYLGSYYLPGVQCEAMYDSDYFVRTKGQWVEVVR